MSAINMKCNFCGCTEFTAMNGRENARCINCRSLERTRLMWMYINKIDIKKHHKILHVAPEKPIYTRLKDRVADGNYVVADYNSEIYKRFAPECVHIDLCNLDAWMSDDFDLIIHSHVLEHTPCNIAYTLYHLHRMLTKEGRHLCIIPFMSGGYDESFQNIGDENRKLRFGQHDHVRRFGRDQIDLHLGKLINMPKKFDATRDFTLEELSEACIPSNQYKGFGIATVLNLGKFDMKFLDKELSSKKTSGLSNQKLNFDITEKEQQAMGQREGHIPFAKAISFNESYRNAWRTYLDDMTSSDIESRFNKLVGGLDDESVALCRIQLDIVPALYPSKLSNYFKVDTEAGKSILPEWSRRKLEEFGYYGNSDFELKRMRKVLDLPETPLPEIVSYSGLRYVHEIAKRRIKNSNVIDAGAYIGDTARLFQVAYQAKCVFAVEPEESTYLRLVENVQSWGANEQIVPVRAATGYKNGEGIIWGEGVGASQIRKHSSKDGDGKSVKVITIDSLTHDNDVDSIGLIKLDVEGAEFDTIKGSVETIRKHRPILLISIYHTAKDFFEIKPFLEELGLGYSFAVRKLTDDLMKELVLIAMPGEDCDKL